MLSSLTVDINILNILKTESLKTETENVLIFTGLNHAIRLFTFINKTQNRDNSVRAERLWSKPRKIY